MFELGTAAQEEHQAMVELTQQLHFDRAVFVGENYYRTNAKEKYLSFEDLKICLEKDPIRGAYVLVKGSRGMALERLLEVID